MVSQTNGTNGVTKPQHLRTPLKYSGSLDKFDSFDVTTIIGREYPKLQLSSLLKDENADVLLRDLAITISQRGVVFFRSQDMNLEQQKLLTQMLGKLSGKPESSTLHVHPLFDGPETLPMNDKGDRDPNVYVIENKSEWVREKNLAQRVRTTPASNSWHTDLTFENVPSDYACLKMQIPPTSGGDTLWASGCEIYDRISPSFREYLSTLTATSTLPYFKQCADENGFAIMSPRGSPDNAGDNFTTVHPVVRTNPVTGWRNIYASGLYFNNINDVMPYESKWIMDYFQYLITQNHDLQVRFKWGKNDVAIWDNRCVFHCATHDEVGDRLGYRTISIGEKPYLDPASTSRRESLAANNGQE